jgi:hypothetical protein
MKQVGAPDLQGQLLRLSTLVQLVKRARHAASREELGFIAVNETLQLVDYRQGSLWLRQPGGQGRIAALSGVPVVERGAPFTLWLTRVLRKLETAEDADKTRRIGAADFGGALAAEWKEWLPAHALWLPLSGPRGRLGALLFARDKAWSEAESYLLQELADGYASAFANLAGRRRRGWLAALPRTGGRLKLAVAALAILALFLPVHLTALAPAEVVPFEPTIVRAPLDGVVDRIAVDPNAAVRKGDLLATLDERALANKLEVAVKSLATADAEYRQAAQQAVFDEKSRARLAVLKGRADERASEAAYLRSLLARVKVVAAQDGIALFSDPNDWIGRPVSIGEKLMEIADPRSAELEIWLPASDAITFDTGADVEFFLNAAPDAPVRAKLRQASYEAAVDPAGVVAYRLKASFASKDLPPRIGLRGTAKIFGERVSLFYYLMRRPLAAARQFLGL